MTDPLEIRDLFIRELAVVVGALSASETTVSEAAAPAGGHWSAVVTFAGPANGTCTVGLDTDGILAVTRALLGGDDVPEDSIAGTVRELLTQAASALQNGSDIRGLTVEVGNATAFNESSNATTETFTRAIASPLMPTPLIVTIEGTLSPLSVDAPQHAAEAPTRATSVNPSADDRIDVILDIDLPLVVRFGRTELPLRALTRLSPGSVVELGRSPDDPVELLVSDRVIARGEVVIVGGNYGVRILDVVSASERVRSMEVSA
jgi:flagellar motor switch protein FliN/FliY